jgi:Domain of unknown function (DUF4386)
MTVSTNARLAGSAYILYVVAGIASMAVTGEARPLFDILMSFSALVLGVTLYAITRDQDADLAMIAMLCRVLEAAPGRGEIYFAVGSTIFCWLLLRGRMIPVPLAWLGTASSGALVTLLLAQGALGVETNWSSPVTWVVWLPMLVFELTFAAWLLTKGVATPIFRYGRQRIG